MRIGIIGAGHVGFALGRGWVRAGHEVVHGLRGSARTPYDGARGASVADTIDASEIVVLATPWSAAGEVLDSVADFGGRVLIDATNPIGAGFRLASPPHSSGAEELARRARGARVVKAFNTTGHENMADSRYGQDRAAMFVAGDDAEARELGLSLARDLGFDAVSIGGLARARQLELLAMLWIHLALRLGHGRSIAFVLRRGGAAAEARPTTAPRAITIVGLGNIGGALAEAWLRTDHSVRVALRDHHSEEARSIAAAGATLVPVERAAEGAEVVVLAVPNTAAPDVLGRLGDLTGRVVVDCTNAVAPGLQQRYGHDGSAIEALAALAPGARFVKSFNQQGVETLRRPRFGGAGAVNFVAGHDAEARELVARLAEDVGLHSVDVGDLSSGRPLEALTFVWIAASQTLGTRDFGLCLAQR